MPYYLYSGIVTLWRAYNFLNLGISIHVCSRAIALEHTWIYLSRSRAQKVTARVAVWYKKLLILEYVSSRISNFIYTSRQAGRANRKRIQIPYIAIYYTGNGSVYYFIKKMLLYMYFGWDLNEKHIPGYYRIYLVILYFL